MITEVVPTESRTLAPLTLDPVADLTGRWLVQFSNPNTRAAYGNDIRHYLTWTHNRDIDPLRVDRATLDVYKLAMCDYTASTVARRLAAVHSWFEYATDLGAVTANPVARVKRPKCGPNHVRLTPALSVTEVSAMVAGATSSQDRALVLLLATTGMRVSECLQLTADSITTERGHHVVTTTGKGGKHHRAPLAPLVLDALTDLGHVRGRGPLFMGADGEPLTRFGACRILARLARRAGLGKTVTPHMLRATAITNALVAGVPLHVVQAMANHADPKTTSRYNRAAVNLDTHPSYGLATELAGALAADLSA